MDPNQQNPNQQYPYQQNPQQQYQQPNTQQYPQQAQYAQQPNPQPQSMSIWAILALIFTFIFPLLGLVFAILAIRDINKNAKKGKSLAVIALVLSIIALVSIPLIIFFSAVLFIKKLPATLETTTPVACREGLIKMGTEEPYDLETDECTGYRCLSNNMVTGGCYNIAECLDICQGECADIQSAKRQC